MSFAEYQPHQIVFLECENKRLYAEVIQTVTDRSLCWARPLAMLDYQRGDRHSATETGSEMLFDLRQGSDLLLPLSWFQVAVDTEVIPILARLSGLKPDDVSVETSAASSSSVQEQLQRFVEAICQANREQAAQE